MSFAQFFERCLAWLTEAFLPVISAYHLLIGNVFLNEVSHNDEGIEQASNTVLTPFHFIFAAREIKADKEKSQRFNYDQHLLVKSSAALLTSPLSIAVGIPLKVSARLLGKAKNTIHVAQKYDYSKLGVPVTNFEELDSPIFQRRPGDENHLKIEKEGLKEVSRLLQKHGIPFWMDCGTCLGTYRYRGCIPWDLDIDIAILQKDHEAVKLALSELDPKLYQLQDWSNRSHPNTYFRLYMKASGSLMDIYHFAVDEENQMLHYILSNEESAFLPNTWKIREKKYKVPTPISVVFPLRKSSFDGIEVFVPNQAKKYLQLRYGEDISPAKIYNEITGNYEKNLDHPYWQQACTLE